jgi:hypothetical protein
MKRWKIVFSGRLVNALGTVEQKMLMVSAPTREQAIQSLYDDYEHISIFSVFEVEDKEILEGHLTIVSGLFSDDF